TAQEREVNAPSIDAQAIDAAVVGCTAAQGGHHFRVQAQHIPVEGVEDLHRSVGEAVDDFEFESLAIEETEYAAAAFRAQVKGEQFLVHRLQPPCVPRVGSQELPIIVQWQLRICPF